MSDKLDDIIRRVEALFNKSASSEFENESESFQRKAQELMTKYQIEEAMLGRSKPENEELTVVKFDISGSYGIDKAGLLNVIAKNNYCRVTRGRGYCKLYGYPSDVKMVVSMYKILNLHMLNEMWKSLEAYRENGGDVSTVSWKKSFFGGYTLTIKSRLEAAKSTEINRAAEAFGNDEFALVLLSKSRQVDEFFQKMTGNTTSTTRTIAYNGGFTSGTAAANNADLGQARLSKRPALNQ